MIALLSMNMFAVAAADAAVAILKLCYMFSFLLIDR